MCRARVRASRRGGLALLAAGDGEACTDLGLCTDLDAETFSGFGFLVGVGYDAWIGEQWSMGVLARLAYGSVATEAPPPGDTIDVDWEATVWVNGQEVGSHRGGYDPFSFDVTDALKKSGPQDIVVAVWDPTDEGTQPRGKQVGKPRGIWYTAVTGIWQTVWLEPVPQAFIAGLRSVPDVDAGLLRLVVQTTGTRPGDTIEAAASLGEAPGAAASGPVGEPLDKRLRIGRRLRLGRLRRDRHDQKERDDRRSHYPGNGSILRHRRASSG